MKKQKKVVIDGVDYYPKGHEPAMSFRDQIYKELLSNGNTSTLKIFIENVGFAEGWVTKIDDGDSFDDGDSCFSVTFEILRQ